MYELYKVSLKSICHLSDCGFVMCFNVKSNCPELTTLN